MSINTPGLPTAWRSPGTYIANAPNSGGGTVGPQPTLILGQKLVAGTAVANVPVQVFAQSECNVLFGAESMISAMFMAYRLNDPTGNIIVCPLADDGAGTTSSQVITITGTATSASTLAIYVNNHLVPTLVNIGDEAGDVAAKFVVAIGKAITNPNTVIGVTASATGAGTTTGVITISAVNAGVTAGDIPVTVNKGGEFTPSGLTVTAPIFTPGATDPDLTTALYNIAPLAWSFLVCPYNSTAQNSQVNTLLSDTVGRWSPVQQNYGFAFSALKAYGISALTTTITYGGNIGSNKHMSVLAALDSNTPVAVCAAIYAGLAAMTVRSNPALPIVGELQGMDSPTLLTRLTRSQENSFLYAGVSPIRVDLSGNPNLARSIQMWQVDTNYLNTEVDFLVEYTDMFIRSDLESTYAQVSLLSDGNPAAAGSGATTPALVLSHVWGLYLTLEAQGIVQNAKTFIATSYCEANISAGVVSLYLPVQTAGQLRIIRVLNSFS